MNEVQAMQALLAGETVARAGGIVLRRIENGRLVRVRREDGGIDVWLPTIEAADDWEIVPREPTLLELAKKIWDDEVRGVHCCDSRPFPIVRPLDDPGDWYAHVELGIGRIGVGVRGDTMREAEKRLRIALEAIIKAEKL